MKMKKIIAGISAVSILSMNMSAFGSLDVQAEKKDSYQFWLSGMYDINVQFWNAGENNNPAIEVTADDTEYTIVVTNTGETSADDLILFIESDVNPYDYGTDDKENGIDAGTIDIQVVSIKVDGKDISYTRSNSALNWLSWGDSPHLRLNIYNPYQTHGETYDIDPNFNVEEEIEVTFKTTGLFGESKNTPTTEENNEPVVFPSETTIEEPKRTVVDIFMEHYDEWKKSTVTAIGYSAVGFLDLDFDGTLELVISSYGGHWQGNYFEFYQVRDDEIVQLYSESDNNSMFPNDKLDLYQNENSNKIYYGNYVNGDVLNSSSFTYDVSQNMIIQELYSTTIDEPTANLTDLNLTYKFTDIRKLTSADEIRDALQESYDAFSYDGYGATTAPIDDTPTDPKEEISGKCGKNAYWNFDEATGRLTISGTGEMDYSIADAVPWNAYRNKINQVFVSEGITGFVFDFLNLTSYTNLKSFVMAESVNSIFPDISSFPLLDSLLKPYIIYGYTGSEAELLAQTHKATFYALNGEIFTYVSCPDTMMAIKNNEGGYNSNIVPIQLIVKNEGKYDLTNVFANLNLPEGVTCDEEVKNLNFSLKSGETKTFDIDFHVSDEILNRNEVISTVKDGKNIIAFKENIVTFSAEIGAYDQENLDSETKDIVSVISTPTETISKSFNIVHNIDNQELYLSNELFKWDVFRFKNQRADFLNYQPAGFFDNDVCFDSDGKKFKKLLTDNERDEYQISDNALHRLLDGDKKTGKQFDNIVKAFVKKQHKSEWGGSCHGMSTVVPLVKGGYLNLSDLGLDSNISKLALPKSDSKVENLVNFYFLQQFLPGFINEKYNRLTIAEDNTSLREVVQETKKASQGGLPVRINYGFEKYDNTEKKNKTYGHSIVGYKCECVAEMDSDGNHRVVANEQDPNFHEYQITIYDCAKTNSDDYSPTYMYIGKDYNYCWYDGYFVKEIRGVSSSLDELNLVDYKTGNWSSICSDHYEMNFLATFSNWGGVHISTSNKKAKLSRMGEGEGDLYTYTVPDTDVALDGDGNEIPNNSYITYFADDFKDEDITLTLGDTDECDFSMIYTDCMVTANGSKVNQVDMESEGAVKIQADNSDYEISLTFNEGYYSMPWYTITASGDSANIVAMEKTEDGIVLNSDNMENVSVIANNFTDEVQLAFSADTDSVLITNNNNSLEIYSDNDNNGTYETLVKTSAPTVEPKSDENPKGGSVISPSPSPTPSPSPKPVDSPNTGDNSDKPISVLITTMFAMWGFRKRKNNFKD